MADRPDADISIKLLILEEGIVLTGDRKKLLWQFGLWLLLSVFCVILIIIEFATEDDDWNGMISRLIPLAICGDLDYRAWKKLKQVH